MTPPTIGPAEVRLFESSEFAAGEEGVEDPEAVAVVVEGRMGLEEDADPSDMIRKSPPWTNKWSNTRGAEGPLYTTVRLCGVSDERPSTWNNLIPWTVEPEEGSMSKTTGGPLSIQYVPLDRSEPYPAGLHPSQAILVPEDSSGSSRFERPTTYR